MTVRDYVSVFRRRWISVVVTLVLALGVAVAGALLVPRPYVARSTVRVATASSQTEPVRPDDLSYSDRLMNTYRTIATSKPVRRALAARLGVKTAPATSVTIPANTELIQITAKDGNPRLAQRAANELARLLVARASGLASVGERAASAQLRPKLQALSDRIDSESQERGRLAAIAIAKRSPAQASRLGELTEQLKLDEQTYGTLQSQLQSVQALEAARTSGVSVLAQAGLPSSRSASQVELIVAIALVLGLLGGLAVALFMESLDTRLHSRDEIEEALEAPVLAVIPSAGRATRALYSSSAQEEAFRRLRTSILAKELDEPLRTILVASAEVDEGKSTVVANLGRAMGRLGRQVVVVDADLRAPTLHRFFDLLPTESGLADVLAGRVELDAAITDSGVPNCAVLRSGNPPADPTELLGSPAMAATLAGLVERYEVVLIDSPALLAVSDGAILASAVDGVLLVVRSGQARRESLERTRRQLEGVRASMLGSVVNCAAEAYEVYGHRPGDPGRRVSDVTTQRSEIRGRELVGAPCSWAYLVGKRSMDLLVGSILLVVLSPLMLLIALAIRLDSPGKALFVQERVGARSRRRDGRFVWQVRPFRVFKFRSMVQDADPQLHRDYVRDFVAGARPEAESESGLPAKLEGDPRVTRVGRLLRRTSLDELPQLFNVLSGSMSIVGPRPVPDYEVECYSETAYERLTAQPGITGPWQVEGRGRVSFEEMLELDLGYVRRRSLLHDASIILRTVPAVLGSKGAR